MPRPLRVVLFSDSFHELNGVGTVSREFAAFAQRRELEFCIVHSGPKTKAGTVGSVTSIELQRGLTFALDKDLFCDPFLCRYRNWVAEQLSAFRPDLIHITGPGDMGVLGFWISNFLGLPMAASWHTNLHEYASSRVHRALRSIPCCVKDRAAAAAEHQSLRALTAFYGLAHFVLAPNQSMVELLGERTGRPSYRMKHGVDTARFCPRGKLPGSDFCIGWVGRLTPEKNVRAFVELERQLLAAGERNFQMLIVGDGSEREWLRTHLQFATLPGFLQGDDLTGAFARMDAFVFPSQTDTFGLVILEAMASGVPVVLSCEAGARIGIQHGVEGFLGNSFAEGVMRLMHCRDLRQGMSIASKDFAQKQTWDNVFQDLYATYETALETREVRRRMKAPVPVPV